MTEISKQEAVEMMRRCREEILSLRATIDRLKPKADAYDNLVTVLNLLPRKSMNASVDMIWILDKRIRELTVAAESSTDVP